MNARQGNALYRQCPYLVIISASIFRIEAVVFHACMFTCLHAQEVKQPHISQLWHMVLSPPSPFIPKDTLQRSHNHSGRSPRAAVSAAPAFVSEDRRPTDA